MTIFNKAVFRLTLIYACLIIFLQVTFSLGFYQLVRLELDRPRPARLTTINVPDGEFTLIMKERDNLVRANLFKKLIFFNLIIASGTIVASYFLAKRTLQPINKMIAEQSDFVSNASHELRTPVTSIMLENEVLLRNKTSTKERLTAQVKSNLEEMTKLQHLTNHLLKLSTTETITSSEDKSAALEQIISILRDNAIKYDPQHREPKITRTSHQIQVIDQGAGIDPADLPHIFERFYRADKSHSSDGYGLGLSLAQRLAAQINAKITATNNSDQGSTFTIHLNN